MQLLNVDMYHATASAYGIINAYPSTRATDAALDGIYDLIPSAVEDIMDNYIGLAYNFEAAYEVAKSL